ncbi:MAG: glycine zipper 2TM domain-containing protein [Pseudomonadota bacterium]
MRKTRTLILAASLAATSFVASAGRGNDVVIGSIIGGATGAVIGNNLGGRDGAIVGGAIGAAAGVAIATDRGGYNNGSGYHNGYRQDDYRYSNNYRRDDYRRDYRPREVVVVESPRHYYYGNEFVYGVPQHHDNGRHRGWDRRDDRRDYRSDYRRDHRREHHHHDRDRRPDVVIIQPAPRRW